MLPVNNQLLKDWRTSPAECYSPQRVHFQWTVSFWKTASSASRVKNSRMSRMACVNWWWLGGKCNFFVNPPPATDFQLVPHASPEDLWPTQEQYFEDRFRVQTEEGKQGSPNLLIQMSPLAKIYHGVQAHRISMGGGTNCTWVNERWGELKDVDYILSFEEQIFHYFGKDKWILPLWRFSKPRLWFLRNPFPSRFKNWYHYFLSKRFVQHIDAHKI